MLCKSYLSVVRNAIIKSKVSWERHFSPLDFDTYFTDSMFAHRTDLQNIPRKSAVALL